MKITFIPQKLNQLEADCEVVLVVNKNLQHKWVEDQADLDSLNFKGGDDEVQFLPHKNRIYVGISSLANDDIRTGVAQAVRVLRKTKNKVIKVGIYGRDVKALAEGFLLGLYDFQKYKSKPEEYALESVFIGMEDYDDQEIDADKIKSAIKEGVIISEAVNKVRDIVNTIPAEVTPLRMSEIAKEMAKDNNLDVKIYGEDYVEQEGMGAFLAVSKASPFPPQLIHLTYKPVNAKQTVCLIGKGLTYDTGGLSLKPSEAMVTMKLDKAGATVIFGILEAASKLKLPVEIHGILGVAENVVGKYAYKPDDVLKAKNGKTIEVKNTDAEGRLVLADCLCYAQDFPADYYIDIATLTGACMVALGQYTIGVMGHSQELKDSLRAAGNQAGELTGDLPFNKYLPKLLKSEVADIANTSSSKFGGAITGALFLSEFVEKKNKDKWAHLDISGPSFNDKAWGANSSGASGSSVRLMVEWLKSLAG